MSHMSHKRSYHTSYYKGSKSHTSKAITHTITQALNATKNTCLAITQAITQALNAAQEHKRSYQTSFYLGSKCHTGPQA